MLCPSASPPMRSDIMSRYFRRILAAAIILALGGLGIILWQQPATVSSPAGGDFTLQSAAGPVSLQDYRRRVLLVAFGYTSCPDICPTTLATTAAALNLLSPAEAGRVAGLFVSLDPERDTLARLKEYVAFFHPALVGVSGSPADVATVAKQYGVFYAKHVTSSGYSVDHSAEIFLVDGDGRLRKRMPYGTQPQQMAAEIRQLLESK